jgi:hypothetical protein
MQRPFGNASRFGSLEQCFGRLRTSGQLLAQKRDSFL